MSPIVTLTSDWGKEGYYGGMLKGRLFSMIPEVRVVDITHSIERFNIIEASFVVKHGCDGFPSGTVHIVDVCSDKTKNTGFVAMEAKGQYFIAANNGLLSLAFSEDHGRVVAIGSQNSSGSLMFAARDIFVPVAAHLANGGSLESLGPEVALINKMLMPNRESSTETTLTVVYIDSYGNAYLNMSFAEFEARRRGRKFNIWNSSVVFEDCSVKTSYNDIAEHQGSGVAVVPSSTGYMQLAMNGRSLYDLLGISLNDQFFIEFYESQSTNNVTT